MNGRTDIGERVETDAIETETDREFIEGLVGYGTQEQWRRFRTECPSESSVEDDEDDTEPFSPSGGDVLPSQRFFGKSREFEMDFNECEEERN